MKDLSLVKKISVILLAALSSLLIFSLITTLLVQNTVFNKNFVNKLVSSNAGYQLVLSQADQAFVTESDSNQEVNISENIDFEQVIKDHVTYEKYKNVSQEIVGAFYSYILGEKDSIEFNIKLFESESEFRALIKDTLILKLESLEPCQNLEQNLQAADNPFEADCKPQQLNQSDIDTYINDMSEKEFQELYDSATFSSDSIDFAESEEQLSNIRQAAMSLPNLILGLFIAIVVLIAVTVLIFNSNRARLAYVGKLLVSSTFVLAIIGIGLMLLNSPEAIAENISRDADGVSAADISSLVSIVRNQLLMSLYLFALTPFVIGVILWILSHHIKAKPE